MEGFELVARGLVKVYSNDDKDNFVDARELHKGLRVETPFHKWIARRIENNKFKEKLDFWTFLSESTGGRPAQEYRLTIDAAKHIAMLEKNDIGFAVRTYFIEVEKLHRKWLEQRINGKATRLTFTDSIQEKFGNNSLKYSNYTNLMYRSLFGMDASKIKQKLGLPRKGKKSNIRDNVSTESLRQIEAAENEISVLISLDFSYDVIKDKMFAKYKSQLSIC